MFSEAFTNRKNGPNKPLHPILGGGALRLPSAG